jgi:hypothetical protein
MLCPSVNRRFVPKSGPGNRETDFCKTFESGRP